MRDPTAKKASHFRIRGLESRTQVALELGIREVTQKISSMVRRIGMPQKRKMKKDQADQPTKYSIIPVRIT